MPPAKITIWPSRGCLQRALARIGLADLRHRERRQRARRRRRPLDRSLKHQRVHDSRQHAHGIGGRPARAASPTACDAADEIAAADHDADGDAELARRRRGRPRCGRSSADRCRSSVGPPQGLAGDLDDDAAVERHRPAMRIDASAANRPITGGRADAAASPRTDHPQIRAGGRRRDLGGEVGSGFSMPSPSA